MNAHSLARTTPISRRLLVRRVQEEGWSVTEAAFAAGVHPKTARKWLNRFGKQGEKGLVCRSSRPKRTPLKTSCRRERVVIELRRRCRWSAPKIARELQMPCSTVSEILARNGLNRLPPLEAPRPVVRYEHACPGDLLHLDIKKLGRIGRVGHRINGDRRTACRGIGWEYVHVAIDDHSRMGYVEVLADEKGPTCAAFLERAVAWFRQLGVRIRQALTDNGSGYRSRQFASTCRKLRLRHRRTRPYTPRTNGKAERFIQTLLREWAYARPFNNSFERKRALVPWLRYYNHARPHGSLGTVPAARLRPAA